MSHNKRKMYISYKNENNKRCLEFMNSNWEIFESRYGSLNDVVIRKQLFFLLKEMNKVIPQNQCIYDVGGNVGEITKLFHVFYPNNLIFTVEPVNVNYKEIMRKFTNIGNIKVYNVALGSFNGKRTSHTFGNGKVGDYLYPRRLLSEFEIEYTTADSFYKKNCIFFYFYIPAPNMEIYFFKLDTEGFEDDILFNSKYLLENKLIKIIYFEYHQAYCHEYQSTLIHFLNKYGYSTYLVGSTVLYSTNDCPNHSLDRYTLGHVIGFNTEKEFEHNFVSTYNNRFKL